MPLIKLIDMWNRRRLYARKLQRARESYRVWLEQESHSDPVAAPHSQTIVVLVDVRQAEPKDVALFCADLLRQSQKKWLAYFLTDTGLPLDKLSQLQLQAASIGDRARWITDSSAASFPPVSLDGDHGWIALISLDCMMAPGALATVLHEADLHPEVRLMYSDHDHIGSDQHRCVPHFKPDLNPEMLLSWNYIGDQFYLHRDAWPHDGLPEACHPRVQRYALLLESTARLKHRAILHIPQILHHVRCEAALAQPAQQKMLSHELASPELLPVIQSHLNCHHPGARAHLLEAGAGMRVEFPIPEAVTKVSILVPTRNAQHFFERCVRSLIAVTDYPHYEILIIDNGSDDPKALKALESLQREDPRVRVVRDDSPFNFSALNNGAVRHAHGDLLLLLNNDTEFTQAGWLREMVSLAVRPEIGCVGAKLYYPDGLIQHVGVVTGICGVAAHMHVKMPGDAPGFFNRAILLHAVSVVTGACLMVRRAVYEQVGGLNEVDLAVAYNDVDFCLRVQDAGLRNVITPFAQVIHHESATRGSDSDPKNAARFTQELAYMKRVWGHRLEWDPADNPNLTLEGNNFEVASQPRRRPRAP
jgi:GT2 family glycosyltransferase